MQAIRKQIVDAKWLREEMDIELRIARQRCPSRELQDAINDNTLLLHMFDAVLHYNDHYIYKLYTENEHIGRYLNVPMAKYRGLIAASTTQEEMKTVNERIKALDERLKMIEDSTKALALQLEEMQKPKGMVTRKRAKSIAEAQQKESL